ncbi:MAG: hypothetical protein ACYC0X_16790 [Pirellulaceae bacterium]
MVPRQLSEPTLAKIRELIEANFAGRDEMYAAAETFDDVARKNICKRLAEHLAAHAVELNQILLVNGHGRYDLADVEFIDHLSERTFLEMVKELHGEKRVVTAIEQCERNLKEKYDRMLESMPEAEAEDVLGRQRDQVEFGEQVFHTMQEAIREEDDKSDRE